jgi:hypothetical protein
MPDGRCRSRWISGHLQTSSMLLYPHQRPRSTTDSDCMSFRLLCVPALVPHYVFFRLIPYNQFRPTSSAYGDRYDFPRWSCTAHSRAVTTSPGAGCIPVVSLSCFLAMMSKINRFSRERSGCHSLFNCDSRVFTNQRSPARVALEYRHQNRTRNINHRIFCTVSPAQYGPGRSLPPSR